MSKVAEVFKKHKAKEADKDKDDKKKPGKNALLKFISENKKSE